ncbi:MAG: hypothetical protein N4A61_06575 [Pelagimonas sp.]|jgi:hypothetical protein|nr:hypothetical protein [Pelagimonas sp.]
MRRTMITLALIAMGNLASADVAWNVGALKLGSVIIMKDRTGASTHIKRENNQFDVFAGAVSQVNFVGGYGVNSNGDLVSTTAVDGAITRYVPHNCGRTLGRCEYQVHHPGGLIETRTRVTEQTRKGLRYKEYGVDGLMTEGLATLDETGTVTGGWTRLKGQPKLKSRRISLAVR